MYVDFSSLFVKFEPYKASFDKYVLEFTSKSFVKKNLWKIDFASCMYKNFLSIRYVKKIGFLPTWKKNLSSMKISATSPLCYKMVALLPMKVVIYHKLCIQQFHENRLIILQEII